MEISMLVNGKIVNNMDMVFITLMMEENMKANLKRIYFMVTVCFILGTEKLGIPANVKTVKYMAMVYLTIRMEQSNIKESGNTTRNAAAGYCTDKIRYVVSDGKMAKKMVIVSRF
jgi:hypothetical protein